MVLCTHCGKQNSNESQFCSFCGNRISDYSYIVGRLILLGDQEGQEYLMAEADRSIGRDTVNDIVIVDTEMSARHARISQANEEFWVEDLDSTNGTHVNGRRIEASTRLRDDDLIKMGRTLLKFKV